MVKEEFGFDTLIISNNIEYKHRWKPLMIVDIENDLLRGGLKDMPVQLRKNIAYNFQYLEYITFQINQLKLNSALKNSLIKNYVIIGSSIIEAIFYYLLKKHDLYSKKDLEIICTTKSNPIKHGNKNIVIETNVYKKTVPYEVEMSFDSMIKKIESKKILNISHRAFPYIKKFRKLRNRIHLQLTENVLDTEWWAFSTYDYLLMRYLLYRIMNDENIKDLDEKESVLYFLKLNDNEMKMLLNYFKNKE